MLASSSSKTADASSALAQRLHDASRQRLGAVAGCAPLRRLDQLPIFVEEEQLARLEGQHPAERLARRPRRSQAGRAGSSCRRRGGPGSTGRPCATRAARPSGAARARHERGDHSLAPAGSRAAVSMLITPTTPVGITSGIASWPTADSRTLDEVRVGGDVDRELHLGGANRATDHALVERQAVGNHRVAAHTDRPEPAVLEHEGGHRRPVELRREALRAPRRSPCAGQLGPSGGGNRGLTGEREPSAGRLPPVGERRSEALHDRGNRHKPPSA